MVMNFANATFLIRTDSAENWASKNPILMKGELGAELDTNRLKLGDGVTVFTELPYININISQFEEVLSQKLDKTGGTITGALTLSYEPSAITDAVTKGYVDALFSSAGTLKREIVDILPRESEADANTIYMIRDSLSSGPDYYKEYLMINGTLTQIGDTSVDLTNYLQKPQNYVSGNLIIFAADGTITDSGVSLDSITINVATTTRIGGVKSSNADDTIRVDEDGIMHLNRVSVMNLYVPEGDELIIDGRVPLS